VTVKCAGDRCRAPTFCVATLGELLAELGDLGRDDDRAVRLAGISREVLLVVSLRLVERCDVRDLGDDRIFPEFRRRELRAHRLGNPALLGRLGEDHGTVLRADVVALAILRRRIVNREKHIEEVAVRQDGGVEGHAHDLGVSRSPAADVVVRRVGVAASGIARLDRFDAGELVEHRLEAPEAAPPSTAVSRRSMKGYSLSWGTLRERAAASGAGARMDGSRSLP
jgi:hypothetical protein